MQKYRLINNIFGWLSFVFAAVVYGMTMESSGSFWDCGEFVSGCYKLQVVHPPGAPFFLMLGRIFTLFSGGNPLVDGTGSHVAVTVNFMSALATAGAVLFTFWTVTALVKKFLVKDGNFTTGKIITIIGAGLIAATAGCFLDSLWFSAVEGEVYALSQFFLSLIFWAIMKWDADDSPRADMWLVLIAYMTGLSIGVHLLSLLALPAIALVYYYKKARTTTTWGWFLGVGAGFVVLGVYMKFIISFTQAMLAGTDKFFVNTLGLPFNSGCLALLLMLVAVLVLALVYTHKRSGRNFGLAIGAISIFALLALTSMSIDGLKAFLLVSILVGGLVMCLVFAKRGYYRQVNVILLCITFSYMGYLSYLMVPIRAQANPPINMNRPIDPFAIKGYVDREQYGDRPLVFGPDYTATGEDVEDIVKTGEYWAKDEKTGTYVNNGDKQDYKIRSSAQMFFPRLGFWQEEAKKAGYRAWLNPDYDVIDKSTGEVVQTFNDLAQANDYVAKQNKAGANLAEKDDIGFSDNLRFFFKYQIGYMYFRYFMWNFAGRQDDIQGTYANDNGRWISGIPFVDKMPLFTPELQDDLPKSALENKARNKFFLLPFIIGLIGLIYTLLKDERTFWIILVLFGTTGMLQIIYQNEPPIEPRERDYAQAGSFLTFTFWMGFGVVAIFNWLKKVLPEIPSAAGAVVLCAAAPLLMGTQGWDDHNRHDRYTARDFAICYLQSCAPNAVLFTQGDNDTYPLWYAQEVEGVRTDIRIINLSLLGVDWYIDQLRYKMNDAAPLKLSFTPEQYVGNNREQIFYQKDPRIKAGTYSDLKSVMKFIANEDPKAKLTLSNGKAVNYLPTRSFGIDIDTNKMREMKVVAPEDYDKIVPRMEWSIDNDRLVRNDLLTLDIIANNIAERPIYFAVSVAPEAYLNMEKYFQLEGLAYRVVPKINPSGSAYNAPVYSQVAYDNMMKKFKFGGIAENPNIYLDENILRMTVNIRSNFGKLADELLKKGETQKAADVIDYSLKVMPADKVPHSVFNASYPEIYYRAGQKDKGRKLLKDMVAVAKDELRYYRPLYKSYMKSAGGDYMAMEKMQRAFMQKRELQEQLYILQNMAGYTERYDPEIKDEVNKQFEEVKGWFSSAPPGQPGAPL